MSRGTPLDPNGPMAGPTIGDILGSIALFVLFTYGLFKGTEYLQSLWASF